MHMLSGLKQRFQGNYKRHLNLFSNFSSRFSGIDVWTRCQEIVLLEEEGW